MLKILLLFLIAAWVVTAAVSALLEHFTGHDDDNDGWPEDKVDYETREGDKDW